ncbi:MAG: hypothetical protein JWP44_595 [Mucilaginibacter sp.]|nr:hypothetical protein [Mucilaginibacter sp.]
MKKIPAATKSTSFIISCLLPLTAFIALLLPACQNQQEILQTYNPPKKAIKKVSIKKPDTIQRDSFCIAAVGDIMLGTSYPNKSSLPPDSGKSSFKNVINELRSADVTFGNLEGTLLNTGSAAHYKLHLLGKAYLFRMPESCGNVLKDAGFKVLSLANNHIGDFGDSGRINTMKVLDSVGIHYGGQLNHPSTIFKINGITYGFCAFAPSANTLPILDLENATRIIKGLKKQCDVVLVSFHGGGEGPAFEHVPFKMESYFSEKRGNVNVFAHNAIDAGADLVFGNGPHVLRGMEIYKNRLIAYSLGNFCTYKGVGIAGVSGFAPILKAYVNKKGEFLSGRLIANIQTRNEGLKADSSNRAAIRIKELTAVDFPNSGLNIADDGLVLPVSHLHYKKLTNN